MVIAFMCGFVIGLVFCLFFLYMTRLFSDDGYYMRLYEDSLFEIQDLKKQLEEK